jgi:hypothetical protein
MLLLGITMEKHLSDIQEHHLKSLKFNCIILKSGMNEMPKFIVYVPPYLLHSHLDYITMTQQNKVP